MCGNQFGETALFTTTSVVKYVCAHCNATWEPESPNALIGQDPTCDETVCVEPIWADRCVCDCMCSLDTDCVLQSTHTHTANKHDINPTPMTMCPLEFPTNAKVLRQVRKPIAQTSAASKALPSYHSCA